MKLPRLYVVPTPIGNLKDITLRALDVLKECDFVIAEDTRRTVKLLSHYDISKPIVSNHTFNEHGKVRRLVDKIYNAEPAVSAALVSDAGTPCISDPGYLLIKESLNANIDVECLPGATAFVPAIVNSNLPCSRFVFEGFLPKKKGRKARLKELAQSEEKRTMIFYEAPHRLVKFLEELCVVFGSDRQACVTKEISKIYETNYRGTLSEILVMLEREVEIKGEFVVVVKGID